MQNPRIQHLLHRRNLDSIITIDFETFFSKDYTLQKMSTTLYVCDPQFLIHGVSLIVNGVNTYYYDIKSFAKAIEKINWSRAALLGHNNAFDALILFRYFNKTPGYYLDTLSMARPLLQNILKFLNLGAIAEHYKVGGKLLGLEDTKGKRKLTMKEAVRLGIYCKNDTSITFKIFEKMLEEFTDQELDVIHYTIQMYAKPQLEVDKPRIVKEIDKILAEKQVLFDTAHTLFPPDFQSLDTKQVLRSAGMLAETLAFNGITPPKKISPKTGKEAFAFARTDLDFQALEHNSNPAGKILYESRLISKSDTALNKAIHLEKCADYNCCPALLNYWRAQTGRWSGGDKIQLQNLPRGGEARLSILAPEGHVLLVSDLSQIELRMAAWFADEQDTIDVFESGKDVYKQMATNIYNVDYGNVTKDQRTVAKVTVLSLGYMCGIKTFDNMLRAGIMGPKIILNINEVSRIHSIYREANPNIVKHWKKCGKWLHSVATNLNFKEETHKGLVFKPGRVEMPGNNMPLIYHNMRIGEQGNFSFQGANEVKRRIYSGLFFENLIQALARNVIAEQMIEAAKHYDVVFCVHDELILSVPENEIVEAEAKILKIMRASPAWCSDLMLDAEAGFSREYSK